ncbi:NAD-dependent epimerase/dehydratase family protein [Aspergillus undulatus]|uniref:NAD-dependent epimerase/dehydratase family protein n=1 Tax=Aspergillus undulatus TaxID=1810928 RepID=UPI003CCDC343
MGKKIVVTGGSGQVGRAVITHLLNTGHDILNLDISPLPADISLGRVHTLRVDLSDAGHVHAALTSRFHPDCPFKPDREPLNQLPDAVIHLAGYPRNMFVPDVETYRVNTMASYNVIEAACRLGIKKIIIASTACVYGPPYAEGVIEFPSFPVDEEVDANPMDAYGISKVCVEKTARGFARRWMDHGVDIYVFRIATVMEGNEYERWFRQWIEHPGQMKAVGWSYTDARDFGRMCELAVEKNGLGFQIFNATNDEITADTKGVSTVEFLEKEAPRVEFTREMGENEAPVTNRKIKDLLGFRQEHSWRDYFSYD